MADKRLNSTDPNEVLAALKEAENRAAQSTVEETIGPQLAPRSQPIRRNALGLIAGIGEGAWRGTGQVLTGGTVTPEKIAGWLQNPETRQLPGLPFRYPVMNEDANQAAGQYREAVDEYYADKPGVRVGLNVAGAVAPMFAGGLIPNAARAAIKGVEGGIASAAPRLYKAAQIALGQQTPAASYGGRMGQMAASGAVQGALGDEGDIGERALRAGIGAAAAPVIGTVAEGVSGAAKALTQPSRRIADPFIETAERIAERRGQVGPTETLVEDAARSSQNLPRTILAELGLNTDENVGRAGLYEKASQSLKSLPEDVFNVPDQTIPAVRAKVKELKYGADGSSGIWGEITELAKSTKGDIGQEELLASPAIKSFFDQVDAEKAAGGEVAKRAAAKERLLTDYLDGFVGTKGTNALALRKIINADEEAAGKFLNSNVAGRTMQAKPSDPSFRAWLKSPELAPDVLPTLREAVNEQIAASLPEDKAALFMQRNKEFGALNDLDPVLFQFEVGTQQGLGPSRPKQIAQNEGEDLVRPTSISSGGRAYLHLAKDKLLNKVTPKEMASPNAIARTRQAALERESKAISQIKDYYALSRMTKPQVQPYEPIPRSVKELESPAANALIRALLRGQ